MTTSPIALVYGRVDPQAPPDEQDNMVQVETVRAACARLGRRTIDVPLSLDLGVSAAVLRSAAPSLAFNLTETIDGQARLIHLAPCLLDSLGIPYTGAPADAIFLTSQKMLAKRMLCSAGIDTPAWVTASEARREPPPFPPPYIVKSVWEHASVGMEDSSVAPDADSLRAEIDRRAAREGAEGLFIEAFVDGREFNLALLGGAAPGRLPQGASPEVLPAAEMTFVDYPEGKPRVVGYRAKWVEDSFEAGSTVRRFAFTPEDGPLLAAMAEMALACWRLFSLRGYARVDFRVDKTGRPFVLEINANPCISPDAGFAAAAGRAGLSMDDVVARIIADTEGGLR
jgi:D-alanine-D-alanine ligase